MEFTNNNTQSRSFYEKDGLKIMSDFNSDKELIRGYMTNGIKEISVRRVKSGWGVSLDYNGRCTRTYSNLTWSEMIQKWDKKLKEFTK